MIILKALYFFLPAYFANMAPVFATKIMGKRLNWPLDFGAKYKGQNLFGENKTWRGLVAAIIIGIITIVIQALLDNINGLFKYLSLLDYSQINLVLYGFLLSFGAIFGDLVKSFFKRRMNIKPGASWFPFDQLDFVLGGLIFISLVYIPNFWIIIILLLVSPILHILANWAGYYLGIKKTKW